MQEAEYFTLEDLIKSLNEVWDFLSGLQKVYLILYNLSSVN